MIRVLSAGIVFFFGAAAGGEEVMTIICAGDSIMRPIPVHLRKIAEGTGIRLDIREWAQGGLNSETCLSYYRRNQARWAGTSCDAVILQLGTNDAVPLLEGRTTVEAVRFRLCEILAFLKAVEGPGGTRPRLFMATVPRFTESAGNAAKNEVVEKILNPLLREVAGAEGAAIVDNHAVLLDKPELYDPDGVHPNAAGERALAESWWRALTSHAGGTHGLT
jgi:lysophospholipase L1-like esterase